jgi:hypothetical protein
MNKVKRQILSLLAVLVLLAIPTALAAAKEIGALTISGPGIKGEFSLTDPKALMKLMNSGFFDSSSFIKAPSDLGTGYKLTAFLNMDSKVVPFVEMVYYPAAAGGAGYMHYTARLNGDSMQTNPVDQWGRIAPAAETAFADVMAANDIKLQAAVPSVAADASAATTTASTAVPAPAATLAAIASILVLTGAALLIRRRSIRQRSASSTD